MTDVKVAAAAGTRCGTCAEALYLTAQVPQPRSSRTRTVGLCPQCDAGRPETQGLLAYFAEHQQVRPEDLHRVHELVGRWLEALTERADRDGSLAADVEAWWAARAG